MAFNGSGTFVRLYNWVNDAASNIKIRADRMDAETDGIATGLSTCITKDGQTTITANLPMAGFKHTGVADGSAVTHYGSVGQIQLGKVNWVAAGGTADALTASYAVAYAALVDGMVCYVRAASANATTTPSFAPSGLTARTITKNGGQALVAGDIYGAGHELILRYLVASTRWELLNPATATISGILGSANGGTANGFTKFSGPTTSEKTFTLPNASATLATTGTNTFAGAQIGTVTALTSSSNSIATNLATNNNFSHTFTEDTTLANPSNPVAGQSGRIFLTQHASSPKTLAFGSQWLFSGGTDPAVTATNSAVDVLYYDVLSTTQIACSLVKGYA